MGPKTLEDLSAKELKVIAKNADIEFDKMASAETMLELLNSHRITEIPEEKETPDEDTPPINSEVETEIDNDEIKEPAEKPTGGTEHGLVEDITAGEFTVVTSINRNNKEYAPGETIVFDEVTDEVRSLVADKVISK